MASILVIEDDGETARQIVLELMRHGYEVDLDCNGATALERLEHRSYDVLTVDRLLPGLDGLDLIQRMRERGISTPVLVLSALSDVEERVRGLRSGGDDYLTKPFALVELCARVDTLLRRSPEPRATLLRLGELELDLITRQAHRGTRLLELKPREFSLLEFLVRHAGRTVTRTMLFDHLWHYRFDPGTNVIDVHIGRLRRQLDLPGETRLLETRRGMGFVLNACH